MEPKINHLLMGCGLLAGLLLGTGNAGGAIALAMAGVAGAWMLRTHSGDGRSLW